jgi:hypothetical protein
MTKEYVELQMYAPGQNLVGGHYLSIYNAGSDYSGPFRLSGDVANGQTQRTVLIGGPGVQAATGVAPDFVFPDFNIPTQGTICWMATIAPPSGVDCVSFGQSFPGAPDAPRGDRRHQRQRDGLRNHDSLAPQ